MKIEGENSYAGKRKHTTISKQTDAIPERNSEGMVSASTPAGNSSHVAEARRHNLPAGDFPLHQATQEQIRSESRTAKETGADSKSLTSEKLTTQLQALEEGTGPRFFRSSPRI